MVKYELRTCLGSKFINIIFKVPMHQHIKTFRVRFCSTLLWLIMGIYSIIIFFIAVIVLPFPARVRHKIIISWTWLFNFCAKNICGVKYQVFGKEYIMNFPAIIASNHQSMWETLCFSQIFPQHVWVLKNSLLKIPFFGWALKISAPIGIDRNIGGEAIKEVLTQGLDRFKQGFWIMTFPEGTRLLPTQRKQYKTGTARLALLLNAPVLPVAHNAGSCYPNAGLCLYPGLITVKICPPIYSSADGDVIHFTKQISNAINAELDKMDAGYSYIN
ncbi:MAG: 1-acyl-sn-glycerol-3-phosphate acyltransferase [Burkholderiales bacterium]|nr:1-acyl-sn-glycerol-3-phosphate acyltransferase [Burkholderiales bacterium]